MRRTVQLAYSGRYIVVVGIQLRDLKILIVVGCIQQVRSAYGEGNFDSLHNHYARECKSHVPSSVYQERKLFNEERPETSHLTYRPGTTLHLASRRREASS